MSPPALGPLLSAGVLSSLLVLAPAVPAPGTGDGRPAGVPDATAPGLEVTWSPVEVRQGGVFLLQVRAPAPLRSLLAHFGRWAVTFWPEPRARAARATAFGALVGVDLEDPPGPTRTLVEARTTAGAVLRAEVAVPVLDTPFSVQHVTVPRRFAELDPPTEARVRRERRRMEWVLGELSPRRLWDGPFRIPLEDPPPPQGFGARRVVNGEPRAPHTGADYAVPAGTPVRAAQAGRVVLAEEHFLPGRAVVLDHGLKLYTMYFHLEAVHVRPGEVVQAGQVLGTVGASGRATGSHLHWGARLGGARVDPAVLVSLTQGLGPPPGAAD